MQDKQKSVATPILPALAVAAIVVALLATYFGAYVWLGEENGHMYAVNGNPSLKSSIRGPGMPVVSMVRLYRNDWLATIFRPAAWLEGAMRGRQVTTALNELLEPIELGPAPGPVEVEAGPVENPELSDPGS